MEAKLTGDPAEHQTCMAQNGFINRYVLAVDHALLWVAALSLAAYFHLSPDYTKAEALLFSTLVAYGAYLCESCLNTVKAATALTGYELNFAKAGLWGWIGLNILVNTALSLLFLHYESWVFLFAIILTAGWQKYMDGRVAPRLQATAVEITKS